MDDLARMLDGDNMLAPQMVEGLQQELIEGGAVEAIVIRYSM